MKLHTEKELLGFNQHQAFKLKQLYFKNRELFDEVIKYLPFSVHLNDRRTLDTLFTNQTMDEWAGDEGHDIKAKGFSFVKEISDPIFLEQSVKKIKVFERINDLHAVCFHTLYLRFSGKMTFYHINKLILDEKHFLNIGYKLSELGKIGKFINDILSEFTSNAQNWEKFQSLTKQEKNVLMLLSKGNSNEEIAENLCISPHTVSTHRKQVYKKLNIKNIRELVQFGQALELLT